MAENEHIEQSADEIMKVLGTDRWLLRSGLVSESTKQNLLMYGYLSANIIDEVEVAIDTNKKEVLYWIYLKQSNFKKYNKFAKAWIKHADPQSLWGKWRKLQLLKKSVYLNIEDNLRRMVTDYLPTFSVKEIKVLPYGHTRQSEQVVS